MIEQWLRWDGPLMEGLERMAQLILLSGLWLLGCLPGITLMTSCAALYDGVVCSFRKKQGTPWRVFLRSYRANLGRGIVATAAVLLPGALIVMNIRILAAGAEKGLLLPMNQTVLLILLWITVYLGPVLSRFRLKLSKALQLAFVICLRFPLDSLWISAGTVGLVLLQIFVLPMALALVLPAAWCLVISLRMERCLGKYSSPANRTNDACYYE